MKPNKQNVKKNYLSSDFSPNFLANLFIKKNSKKIYKLMEEYELNTIKDEYNTTLLHFACQYNKIDIVESMIKLGADINAINDFSLTPMSMATSRNYYELVKLLLTHGAEVFLPDHDGNTPLHYASKLSNIDMINILINHKADLYIHNKQGCLPIHFTVTTDSLQLFFNAGVNVDVLDKESNTLLHLASIKPNNLKYIKFLISNNANINCQNKMGYTPLHLACDYEHIDNIKFLLSQNADINIKNNQGLNVLDLTYGNDEIINILNTYKNYNELNQSIISSNNIQTKIIKKPKL